MIKLLHTADWHFGYRQYGLVQRELDFYAAGKEIAKLAIDESCDAVLIAGDLFDAVKPPAAAVAAMQNIVTTLNANNIRVIGIDGNHDLANGEWLKVCGIEHAAAARIVVRDKSGRESVVVSGVDSCRPDTFYSKIADMVRESGDPSTTTPGLRNVDILMVHQAVSELCNFSTQDYDATNMAAAVSKLGVKYVALGDIHARNSGVYGGVSFAYPGSIEMKSADEQAVKGCTIVEVTAQSVTTRQAWIKTRPFIVADLTGQDDLDALKAKLAEESELAPIVVALWSAKLGKEFATSVEAALKAAGCMFRLTPYAGDSLAPAQTFERDGSIAKLQDAVAAFFEDGSDEYQLVFRLLSNTNRISEVVDEYIKEKSA